MINSNDASCLTALGLMTGTSMDGIDAAIIRTDGERQVEFVKSFSLGYDEAFSRQLRTLLGPNGRQSPAFQEIERSLTDRHAELVARLLDESGLDAAGVDIIGFHGQTIFHDPANGVTDQIGDGNRLAQATGVDVVADFRSADVAAGGEGAPFAPLYHAALANQLSKPVAVLNLGGVGNVTYLGPDDTILAFDTGPASALIDDWCQRRVGQPFDRDGALAASGSVDSAMVGRWLENTYFETSPPKSLDRNTFDVSDIERLSDADGAATLMSFTIASVARALEHLPEMPKRWLVTGGGRHNTAMMRALQDAIGVPVEPVESVGWDGDVLEAQAFAYLAVRSIKGLPLSVPGTTGVAAPTPGGRLFKAA